MTAVLPGVPRQRPVRPRASGPPRPPRLLVRVPPEQARVAGLRSTYALRDEEPELSAYRTLSQEQRVVLLTTLGVVLVGLVLATHATAVALVGVATVVYAGAVAYRLLAFRRGLQARSLVRVTDEEALAVPAAGLPRYTILVPAFREPEVIAELMLSLANLDYPKDRLEVLVLLEADDPETLAAVREARPADFVRVLVVPEGELRTKPKACNYGLAFATGELVTIYDAEDHPEPLQLRRAAVAFARLPRDIVCLQAQLGYFNADQNRITKWFTAEYVTWFAHFLPGLVSLGAPVPLGGTSNHMRADILRELGGWDPFNVTEDADLGIRLHRAGYRTGVLDSVTLEEANSDFVNWTKQRSRWYKGYLQTALVHLRDPRALRRELGLRGVVGLVLFVGGTPLLSLLNPLFWSLTLLWLIAQPQWVADLFPGGVYYAALALFVFGNAAIVYMGVVSVRHTDRPELLGAALTVPAYWVMMAIAAIKAFVQLVQSPSFWEKTTHGLSLRRGAGAGSP